MWWYILTTFIVFSVVHGGGDWREVRIAQGPVRGRRDDTGELFVFYNIPYATAPTGGNKFKAPLPPPQWTKPFEAIDKSVICPQAIVGFDVLKNKTMQENCLIANVYVPDTSEKNLSVLVSIHGGAFQLGVGDWFKPKNLMKSKKLIVVTFNYRLGIHGFLCLGTKGAPGNAGMKDQLALLRWVKKNIAYFGGNPNDVTITGFSAGAASVDLMILSKSAEGLFNKVIVESGANIAPFTMQRDPLEYAKSHAKSLNFNNVNDINALEKFYQSLSYETLTQNPFIDRPDSTFIFSPCVELDLGEEVFLADSPVNILKNDKFTKVPMLYGFTSMEGLIRKPFLDNWLIRMNEKFSDFLPADLKFRSVEQKEKVAQSVKEFYFGNKPIDSNSALAYIEYFTDAIFTSPAIRSLKWNVGAGNDQIYLFEYSFVDESTPFVPYTMVRGVDHCDETVAVYDGTSFFGVYNPDESAATEAYKNMKRIMRELWHNFITTGKPVPEGSSLPAWPATRSNGSPYMSLGTTVELRNGLLEKRLAFWNAIYKRYYREPVPPSIVQNPLAMITSLVQQFFNSIANDFYRMFGI